MHLSNKQYRSSGFSLVELMVAVVVGMLAVIFATRLLVRSEQEKSAAVGTSDSMQNGMLAMFQINNDATQAGWGLNSELVAGCDTRMQDTEGYQLLTVNVGGVPTTPLAPVVIQSVNRGSDVISLNSGTSLAGIGNVGVSQAYNGGSEIKVTANNPFNFLQGDVLLVAPEPAGAPCSLAQLAVTPQGATSNELSFASNAEARFNAGSLLGGNYGAGQARVFNLGRANKLSFHIWSVNNGVLRLRATDLAGTSRNPQSVISNVVAIKAQYGFDTVAAANNPAVTVWSPVMIDADGNAVVGNPGDYQRVVGIRLAVIARSAAVEKPDPVTGTCSATTQPITVFSSAAPAGVAPVEAIVDLAVPDDPISWTCYRYRAFETIIPIRNMGWRI